MHILMGMGFEAQEKPIGNEWVRSKYVEEYRTTGR